MPKSLPVIDTSAPICCAPIAAGPMAEDEALALAVRLKALADPVRIRLVSQLMAAYPESICACDLTEPVGLTAGTVSHHLGQLRKAGLVSAQKQGVNVFYRAEPDALEALRAVLATCC